jgi:hypothetical protein
MENWGMSFYYQSKYITFKSFLSSEEEGERHLLHAIGQRWVAERFNATIGEVVLNPEGETVVEISGIGSLADHYRLGVAGVLAEAKGIVNRFNPDSELNTNPAMMKQLATAIVDGVKAHARNPHHGFTVDVPFTPAIPSRESAAFSVSALTHPIQKGLSVDQVYEALIEIATIFNDPLEWADFKVQVETGRPL